MNAPQTAYINGKIYTVNNNFDAVSAFAVLGDRFFAVGTDEEILSLCTTETQIIDLNGHTVLPGLTDAHLHLIQTGKSEEELKLAGLQKEEIIDLVARACQSARPGEWILGSGWINDEWQPDSSFPTKDDLDAVSPDNPVYLIRGCRHMSWVNTKAMDLAGITEDTPDPVGGEILKLANGKLAGIVTDQAQAAFNAVIPEDDKDSWKRAILFAQDSFFKAGLTSIHDAGASPEQIEVIKSLYNDGELKIRINESYKVPDRPAWDRLYPESMEIAKSGIQCGLYDNRLNIRSYKLTGDGSLGARSAWLKEDYSDRPGHKGNGKWTDDQLYTLFLPLHKAGFQIWLHAIGDASNKQALDVYKRLQEEFPRPDARHRIEHAQILSPDELPRFYNEGVIPTEQTVFIRTDKRNAEARVGERIKYSYAWRTLIDMGNILPNGTDSPVESFNPFLGIYCAVTRKDEHGQPENGWYTDQAMTRQEAIRSYTVWPAYASFEENIKGSIAPGMLADFIIIDKDIMTCDASEIKDIHVTATFVGGEQVYSQKTRLNNVLIS